MEIFNSLMIVDDVEARLIGWRVIIASGWRRYGFDIKNKDRTDAEAAALVLAQTL